MNPPAVIYLLMIPAAISSNPLWGAIFVGLLNVIAVLLTYIFVRRYYGRIASIIASLLYATASGPLHYSRFIWQQNMIAPFVVLFIFALFWGVVDRRKGWLFPALVLLGILDPVARDYYYFLFAIACGTFAFSWYSTLTRPGSGFYISLAALLYLHSVGILYQIWLI